MRSVRAKKLLKQARKNARTGKVDISSEYDRLKKEYNHKRRKQNPKAIKDSKGIRELNIPHVYWLKSFNS